jgi:hypothetical protein
MTRERWVLPHAEFFQILEIEDLGLPVAVERDEGVYVATPLGAQEVELVFGSGSTPGAAVEDLYSNLNEVRDMLRQREATLSAPLQAQLRALDELLVGSDATTVRRTGATRAVSNNWPLHSWGEVLSNNGGTELAVSV